MAKRKKTTAKDGGGSAKAEKSYRVGPDGKNANQRLREELGPERGRIAWLARLCNTQVPPDADGKPYIDQRNIQRFVSDDDDLGNSGFVGTIATCLGVRSMWLQHGQLPKKDEAEQVLRELSQRFGPPPPQPEPPRKQ